MSPEMKDVFFKQKFRENNFNIYKSGVFSLGLVGIYLGSLEDMWGQNMEDEKIKSKLKSNLKIVKQRYGREMKNVIKKMIEFDSQKRFSFRELDDSELFNEFVNINFEEQEQNYLYKNTKEMEKQFKDEQYLENIYKHTRKMCFFKIEKINDSKWFYQLFDNNNKKSQEFMNQLQELQIMWSEFLPKNINHVFQSGNLKNLLKLKVSGIDDFYVDELKIVLNSLQKIKFLDFSGSLFDGNCLQVLCSYQNICGQLSGLNLNSNFDIGDQGFQVLGYNINLFTNLKYLYLGGVDNGCGLTETSLKLIIDLYQEGSITKKLKYLDLSWNEFGTQQFLNIVQSRVFKDLEVLNLQKCKIDITDYRFTQPQKEAMKNILV